MNIIETNDWTSFYEDRINSTYQDYFEERYDPFLQVIKLLNVSVIREEGVGIGSVTKALNEKSSDQLIFGYDILESMVNLAELNNPGNHFYCDSILNYNSKVISQLAVTHGVLEHFSDDQIKSIFNRYRREGVQNVHYVPLDKYVTPSFGDERLLPYYYWLELVRPKDYILFNDDHDMILIN